MDDFDRNFKSTLRTIQAFGATATLLGCFAVFIVAAGFAVGIAYLAGAWSP